MKFSTWCMLNMERITAKKKEILKQQLYVLWAVIRTFDVCLFKDILISVWIPTFLTSPVKGIFHYFTMSILEEQAVYGHHNGVILSFQT